MRRKRPCCVRNTRCEFCLFLSTGKVKGSGKRQLSWLFVLCSKQYYRSLCSLGEGLQQSLGNLENTLRNAMCVLDSSLTLLVSSLPLPAYSAHSLMGYCHSRLGMGKKAVVNYNIALQLNPGDVSSQGLLAEAKKSLICTGETVETIAALEVTEADIDEGRTTEWTVRVHYVVELS